jgi:HAD superfamily hydrolase (TIGR01509 family)
MLKPDPTYYNFALNTMNVKAKETIFIDDVEDNILAAKRVGINGILFTGKDQLIKTLEEYGLQKR